MNEPFRPRKVEDSPTPQYFNPAAAAGDGVQIKGQIPPAMQAALQAASSSPPPQPNLQTNSNDLRELIERLKPSSNFEEVLLPSLGKFYDGTDGPADGILHIRPMTGNEEQVLATGRLVKDGQAIDMIFKNCIMEKYPTEKFLSIDRNFLLIKLRGISYGPLYEVEIACPNCENKFEQSINLNLPVDNCPDDFGLDKLSGVLPDSQLPFSYSLQKGLNEIEINDYRERNKRRQNLDDTLIHRTAMLLNSLGGFTNKSEIKLILNNLKVNDLSYLRNCMDEPPFGVDTTIDMACENCLHEFSLELPIGPNFFFPRQKKQ